MNTLLHTGAPRFDRVGRVASLRGQGRGVFFLRRGWANVAALVMLGALLPSSDRTEATASPTPFLPPPMLALDQPADEIAPQLQLNFNQPAGLIAPPRSAVQQQGRWKRITVSYYCKCSRCCGEWAQWGLTASGTRPREGVTIAASRKIPFGAQLYIQGIGWRRVEDRLSEEYDGRVDVYIGGYGAHRKALELGLKDAWVWIPRG